MSWSGRGSGRSAWPSSPRAPAGAGGDRERGGRGSRSPPGLERANGRGVVEALPAEAADLPQLVDAVERAVRGAVVDDPLRERRTDAGELFEILGGRQVQMDEFGAAAALLALAVAGRGG